MVRSMTSDVSALSSVVANGHQTLHFVSSAPSKIPYGGFSPVRLQTRLTQRPPSRAFKLPLIGRHCRYLVSRRLIRSRTFVQAAPRTSDHDRESSGPWLRRRLFCPSASSLTMATSALLRPPNGLWIIPSGCEPVSPAAEGPQFTLPFRSPHAAARTPVAPAIALNDVLIAGFVFAELAPARQPQFPTAPNRVGSVTRLQRSLHATAWSVAGPASARTFTTELSWVGSPPAQVGYDWMVHRHLPSPDFHRLDWQHYGLRANPRS
jgi:hypothetical protein